MTERRTKAWPGWPSRGRTGMLVSGGLCLLLAVVACGDDGGGAGGTASTAGTASGATGGTATVGATEGVDETATSTADTTAGGVSPEDAIVQLVQARCEWLFACCASGEIDFALGPFTVDAADCTERVLDVLSSGNPGVPIDAGPSDLLLALTRSFAQGRITLDAAAVAECVAHLADAGCTPIPGGDEHCDPARSQPVVDPCALSVLAIGLQEVGQECEPAVGAECVPGARCVDFGTSGVCAQLSAESDSCFIDADCQDPLVCDLVSTGECVVGGSLGDACSFADPKNPLPGTEVDRCARGLLCDASSTTCVGGSCGPGAPCVDDSQCPVDHFCVADACQGLQRGGGPCEVNEHCQSGFCSLGTHTCSTPSGSADGTACVASFQCISAWCDPTTQVCEQPNEPGQPCESLQSAECKDGFCDASVPANPVCVGYGDLGDPCTLTSDCDSSQYLTCVGMQCSKLQSGDPCFNNLQCEDGLCFTSQCDTPLAVGAPCGAVAMYKPCVEGSFCDVPLGTVDGSCTALLPTGSGCVDSTQCFGECVERWAVQMCDDTPAVGAAWCDGR